MSQDSTTEPEPKPTLCTCCQNGQGISECWNNAYQRGRQVFIAEIHSVLATDYQGHFPGHDCDVCRITSAMVQMTPSLRTIMDSTTDWFITIVSDPVARQSLKEMIVAAEDAERRN